MNLSKIRINEVNENLLHKTCYDILFEPVSKAREYITSKSGTAIGGNVSYIFDHDYQKIQTTITRIFECTTGDAKIDGTYSATCIIQCGESNE